MIRDTFPARARLCVGGPLHGKVYASPERALKAHRLTAPGTPKWRDPVSQVPVLTWEPVMYWPETLRIGVRTFLVWRVEGFDPEELVTAATLALIDLDPDTVKIVQESPRLLA